jgi:hypothetical protein
MLAFQFWVPAFAGTNGKSERSTPMNSAAQNFSTHGRTSTSQDQTLRGWWMMWM